MPGAWNDPNNWDYATHPDASAHLVSETRVLLAQAQKDEGFRKNTACDTRPAHSRMFRPLTPPGCEYFAGNFRGSAFPYLNDYEVIIAGERGTSPDQVSSVMAALSSKIEGALRALDTARPSQTASASIVESFRAWLLYLAFTLFYRFETAHPYANGNGHAGRLMFQAILLESGYRLKKWPIHPRPPEPYVFLHQLARIGRVDAVADYLTRLVDGPEPEAK